MGMGSSGEAFLGRNYGDNLGLSMVGLMSINTQFLIEVVDSRSIVFFWEGLYLPEINHNSF